MTKVTCDTNGGFYDVLFKILKGYVHSNQVINLKQLLSVTVPPVRCDLSVIITS